MIYLDNGATTFPKPECVYEATDHFARTGAVNAGRGAYHAAREATEMIKQVKAELISLCDAREQAEIVFTHSVTIALNEIIGGYSWDKNSVVYVTPYEHNAVLRPLELLKQRVGITVIELPLKDDLSIDLEKTEEMFKQNKPDFVCVTAVSNVTGYILPAREIFLMAKEYGAFTLYDASQAMGLIRITFGQLFADAIAFAGHKTLYAPFGIAGFLIKENAPIQPFITGGNGTKSLSLEMPPYLPDRLESSSLNTVAIAGLQASLKWLKTIQPLKIEQELTDYMIDKLKEIPQIILYTAPDRAKQSGVISLNMEGLKANETAAILDHDYDIAVRAGHHCAALIHRHLNDAPYDGTVRVSLSVFTTKEEIDALVKALSSIDKETLKKINPDVLRGSC